VSAQTLAWILLATLVLGFIAIAIDDWAGKVIDRHVERALNEGER
jgi:hypothetical protein